MYGIFIDNLFGALYQLCKFTVYWKSVKDKVLEGAVDLPENGLVE